MFAITAAVIAGGKGRSVVGWFFLGLVFAVIMVAFLPAVARDEAAEAAARGDWRGFFAEDADDWMLHAAVVLAVWMVLAAIHWQA